MSGNGCKHESNYKLAKGCDTRTSLHPPARLSEDPDGGRRQGSHRTANHRVLTGRRVLHLHAHKWSSISTDKHRAESINCHNLLEHNLKLQTVDTKGKFESMRCFLTGQKRQWAVGWRGGWCDWCAAAFSYLISTQMNYGSDVLDSTSKHQMSSCRLVFIPPEETTLNKTKAASSSGAHHGRGIIIKLNRMEVVSQENMAKQSGVLHAIATSSARWRDEVSDMRGEAKEEGCSSLRWRPEWTAIRTQALSSHSGRTSSRRRGSPPPGPPANRTPPPGSRSRWSPSAWSCRPRSGYCWWSGTDWPPPCQKSRQSPRWWRAAGWSSLCR